MVTASYRLREDFAPTDVIRWWHNAPPGEIISISLPGQSCAVRLIRGINECVSWWPEQGRSVTVSLNDAVQRLSMF